MEFFYTDDQQNEQGPYTERQMTDWIRVYPTTFGEDRKIRFKINEKVHNTTLARMRAKNGHCTPFVFVKCERVDKEKELRKELEEAARDVQRVDSIIGDIRKSMNQSSLEGRQLMERMQRRIDAARAQAEAEAERVRREEEEGEEESSDSSAAAQPSVPVSPPPGIALPTSKSSKRLLPLIDVAATEGNEQELEDDRKTIKAFRNLLDEFDLFEAQKKLKYPICEKCRGCDGKAVADNDLRSWLCHITSKNHLEKFRQRGGRVTQRCLDFYAVPLAEFLKAPEREHEDVVEESVDLEKKKLDCYGGVIMLPPLIPLLHIDPSDTTKLSPNAGRNEISKLRELLFRQTDKYSAAKSFHLPRTNCDVCNVKFDYTPKIVPHLVSNAHIDKYLAKRGAFSQHDFVFWTQICKLFPDNEAGKDQTRDQKEVRGKLREMGRNLDISACKDSRHRSIFGGEDRRRHVLDFILNQLMVHKRPVVVYMRTEETANELIDFLKEELPETRIGYASSAEECEQLEVIVTDSTLRLTRLHAIAFPAAPMDMQQKAAYAQKMCGEYVESNLIVALGYDEQAELRKFSRRVIAYPQSPQATVTPTVPPTTPTVNPTTPTVTPTTPTVSPTVSTAPSPRVSLPTASIPPFNPFATPPRSESYPKVPENQRKYDPSKSDESPNSPGGSKKSNCSVM